MKRVITKYRLFSSTEYKAESIPIKGGKWSLIFWLLTNQFSKGSYLNRDNIEIKLYSKRVYK